MLFKQVCVENLEKSRGHLQIYADRTAALRKFMSFLQAVVIQHEQIVSFNTFVCEFQAKRHWPLRFKPNEQGFTHESLRGGDEASQSQAL